MFALDRFRPASVLLQSALGCALLGALLSGCATQQRNDIPFSPEWAERVRSDSAYQSKMDRVQEESGGGILPGFMQEQDRHREDKARRDKNAPRIMRGEGQGVARADGGATDVGNPDGASVGVGLGWGANDD